MHIYDIWIMERCKPFGEGAATMAAGWEALRSTPRLLAEILRDEHVSLTEAALWAGTVYVNCWSRAFQKRYLKQRLHRTGNMAVTLGNLVWLCELTIDSHWWTVQFTQQYGLLKCQQDSGWIQQRTCQYCRCVAASTWVRAKIFFTRPVSILPCISSTCMKPYLRWSSLWTSLKRSLIPGHSIMWSSSGTAMRWRACICSDNMSRG